VVTYTVVIAAENSRNRLLPGMTANVEITAEKRKDVLRIAENTIRFKPGADGPQLSESTQGDSNNNRRGQRSRDFSRLFEGLELDVERKKEIEKQLTNDMREFWSSMSGNSMATFNRNRMREMMQARIEKILKANFSDDEYKKYQQQQKASASTRRVELFQENSDKTLSKKNIVIGLSDGKYVEIKRGADEGDEFIERIVKSAKED